jgi:LuxR family quorum sensing-dependent transcriptional regulator
MRDYPQRMFDAVSDFETITTIGGVTERLGDVLSSFGYTAFLVTSVPEPPLRLEPYILLNGWPRGWTEHYGKHDYYNFDPVAAFARKAINPFEWSEAEYDPIQVPRAAEVMNVARDFGMNEGYLVPIVRSAGFHACITMAGERPDLDPMAKRVIHVISMFAHGRISTLMGETVRRKAILTPTEREILSWTACGKSSWEIGQILGIAKSSVDTMAYRAAKKLDAVTRTQAVVNALRTGEITF